jgi:hypothetical protein
LIILAALAAFAALGCEDGPAQLFTQAPPGAGDKWNNGNTAPAAVDGGQSFDAGYPRAGKTVLCSDDVKRKRWAWMLTQPIKPPRFYAGIDMAKDDQWDGLTIEDAESAPSDPMAPAGGLCQSIPFGFQGGCPSGFGGCNGNGWGDNSEVLFFWNVATHLVDQMELQLGYTGTMSTNMYPDHNGEMHSYSVAVGDIVRRDNQPFEIQWNNSKARAVQITDIFNATMATFSSKAGVPFDTSSCTDDSTCNAPGTVSICQCAHAIDPTTMKPTSACMTGSTGQCGVKNCGSDGNCLIYNDGSTTIFGIRPMVVYVLGTGGIPQPALSTPGVIYNFFSKWEPFSNLPQIVKLDAEGPVATGTPVGVPMGMTNTCVQKIGQTFEDFKAHCVQVHGDSSDPNGVDTVNLNKVVHSLTHDQEHWTANVLGVNQNFTSSKVLADPTAVVLDTDSPGMGDIAQDWTFDVRARGQLQNDYTFPAGFPVQKGAFPDFRGSALVMIEWARLMLADIARITGNPVKTLGDPTCVGFDSVSGQPNYKVNKGCSGIEGLIIPNAVATYGTVPTDFSGDPVEPNVYPGANADVIGVYVSILKPGAINGAFCIDPGSEGDCTADQGVSIFQNALYHVRRVMGDGLLTNLPSELQDRRYYFKWYGAAYIKYLKAYANYDPTQRDNFPNGTKGSGLAPSDVHAQQIDYESLFFDYTVQTGGGGAQTFDKFEYIDRDNIGMGSGGMYNFIPWDFEYGCDLFGGNQRYDNFFRRMDREEIALYSAMLTDKTHTAGQENNVNITNLFGSLVLAGNPAANVAGAWPSYACAIGQAGDPAANCNNANAPLEPGNPSNAPACGAKGACPGTMVCGGGNSYEAGFIQLCGDACDFTTYPASGCKSASQTCAGGACIDMKMDKNGPNVANPKPLLSYYPGAWSRTPFSMGHSPITIAQADKHPDLGVAKITIPNFKAGPYTQSPTLPGAMGCPMGYSMSTNGVWCQADLNAGTGNLAPSFTPLTPWLEVQPAVGFSIPLDAQHSQWVSAGQFDFTGVLETYIVDYLPYVDPNKHSCITDGVCKKGFTCNSVSHACETDDNTIQVAAIEGADFLGQAFVCQDPWTSDILHVGMYDSAVAVLDWLAAHPGGSYGGGPVPSAQAACQILVIRSPYDNYVDFIVAKGTGVSLDISGGQGQGRVTDIILFDPSLIQDL